MVFILLQREGLVVLTKESSHSISFSPECIRHQEVIDKQKFEAELGTQFSQLKPSRCVVFLGEELVFWQTFLLSDSSDQAIVLQKQSFQETIPFSSTQLNDRAVRMNGQEQYYVVNSSLYESVITVLIALCWKVDKVLPLQALIDVSVNQALSFELLDSLNLRSKLAQQINFIDGQTNTMNTKWYFAIVVVICIGIIVFAYLSHFF